MFFQRTAKKPQLLKSGVRRIKYMLFLFDWS
jgi:hypothetical protein